MSPPRAVFHVTMMVHVCDGVPVARGPQQLRGVCDDCLVWVDVSLASGRGHCIAELPEAQDRNVPDDLVDAHDLESVVQVTPQEGRGEQDLIVSINPHEHAARSCHDVVLFGVSAHERIEIVARQTDVFEHGLHHGKVRTQRVRHANVALDHTEHGSCTYAGQDLL